MLAETIRLLEHFAFDSEVNDGGTLSADCEQSSGWAVFGLVIRCAGQWGSVHVEDSEEHGRRSRFRCWSTRSDNRGLVSYPARFESSGGIMNVATGSLVAQGVVGAFGPLPSTNGRATDRAVQTRNGTET